MSGDRTMPGPGGPLRGTLLERGAEPVLLDDAGRTRTGAELVQRVDALAGALADTGLRGERVGVWYANSLAAFEAYLAVEWVGATRVVLDPATPAAEARAILGAAGARASIADGAHAQLLDGTVLTHDDEQACAGPPRAPDPEVPAARPLHLYPRAVQDGELLAVPISYANWQATIELNCRLYRSGAYGPGWGEDERLLTVQQLLHGTALMGSFPFLAMGLPQVIAYEFDPARVPELVERFAITATGMTSGMLSLLAERSAGRWQPGTLRRVLYGGAPLAEADMRRAVEVVGPVLVQVYGRLEGGWPLTVLSPFDHDAILAGDGRLARSCGRAIDPHVELRLRPVAGAGDASGELGTRSAMVVGEYADPDGWCQLGDLARRDDDGYVFLEGRLDDMINTGYHVYPAQVEEALLSLAGVRGARVRGEPDAKRGEAIAAYVVSDGEQDADALRERLRALLAPYKIPHRISFVASLPVR